MSQAIAAHENHTPSDSDKCFAGARILVADDSKVACAVLEDILTGRGSVTCRAHSVSEVTHKVASFSPQLIILSHWLPEGDTLQLLASLLGGRSAKVPIIVTLTSDALDEGIRSVNAGAFDCLYKPLQPADVLARVYRALHQLDFAPTNGTDDIRPDAADTIYSQGLLEPLLGALEEQFMSRASSELQQPLRTLMDFSQSIQSQKGAVDVHKALGVFRAFLAAAKSLIASANPTELFSSLDLDHQQQWQRRLDNGRSAIAKPHLTLSSRNNLKGTDVDSAIGSAKQVG